jgi:hypothetical protein
MLRCTARSYTLTAALIAALSPACTLAANVNFCWIGAGGDTMTGRMQIPDDQMRKPVLTKADLNRFKISGYHQGQFVRAWGRPAHRRHSSAL